MTPKRFRDEEGNEYVLLTPDKPFAVIQMDEKRKRSQMEEWIEENMYQRGFTQRERDLLRDGCRKMVELAKYYINNYITEPSQAGLEHRNGMIDVSLFLKKWVEGE